MPRPRRVAGSAAGQRARKTMNSSRASRARAVARWRVTDSACSLAQTTMAPSTAWDSTMTSAPTAAQRTAAGCRPRQAATARALTSRITAAATSRWECSIQACSSGGGVRRPKQRGQSGQPSPESVALTSPPTMINTKVAGVVRTARRWKRVNGPRLLVAAGSLDGSSIRSRSLPGGRVSAPTGHHALACIPRPGRDGEVSGGLPSGTVLAMSTERRTDQLGRLASDGSATPLPPPSTELRLANGRLAPWVFGLPVAELRAGYRSAVYFDRARRILAAEGADTVVTMQVFQRNDGVVACGVDEALAVLALGAGAYPDQAAADQLFTEHLRARNQARRARVHGGAAYLQAVRAQVDTEIALDRLWQPGAGALEVRALRDGDRVDAWEPVIETTGPYRLIAHLESVYLGVLARRSLVASNVRRGVTAAGGKPGGGAAPGGGGPPRGQSRCCSSPTASTTGRPRAATATPPSWAARRAWPPTPRPPGGASAASAPSPTP